MQIAADGHRQLERSEIPIAGSSRYGSRLTFFLAFGLYDSDCGICGASSSATAAADGPHRGKHRLKHSLRCPLVPWSSVRQIGSAMARRHLTSEISHRSVQSLLSVSDSRCRIPSVVMENLRLPLSGRGKTIAPPGRI